MFTQCFCGEYIEPDEEVCVECAIRDSIDNELFEKQKEETNKLDRSEVETMSIKTRDRVWITDSTGMKVAEGTVVSVNEWREPSLKYAIDVDGYKEDLVFMGEDCLVKQDEE